jgi:hypothetical protein
MRSNDTLKKKAHYICEPDVAHNFSFGMRHGVGAKPSLEASLLVAALFVLLSPMYALPAAALISCFYILSFRIVAPLFCFAFVVTMLSRDLGVRWSDTAGDDVPSYLILYYQVSQLRVLDLFKMFTGRVEGVAATESGYGILLYVLGVVSGTNFKVYLVIQYLFSAMLVVAGARIISRRMFMVYLYFGYFFFLGRWYQSAHLFRNDLANSILIIGIALYLLHGKKTGLLVGMSSLMFHLSSLPGVGVLCAFAAFDYTRKRRLNYNTQVTASRKISTLVMTLVFIFCVPIILFYTSKMLAFVGYEKLLVYLMRAEGYDHLALPVLIRGVFYMTLLVILYIFFKMDKFIECVGIMFAISLGVGLFYPENFGLFGRLMSFARSNLTLAVCRLTAVNFHKNIMILAIVFLFVFRVAMIHNLSHSGGSVWAFLGQGDLWNPFVSPLYLFQDMRMLDQLEQISNIKF